MKYTIHVSACITMPQFKKIKREEVLELDSGDGLHNIVNILKTTEYIHFKVINFMLWELYLNLKQKKMNKRFE